MHLIFTFHRKETVNPTLPYSLYNRVVGFKRSLIIKIMTLLIFLILKPEFVILLQTNQGRKWTLASWEINRNIHICKQKRKKIYSGCKWFDASGSSNWALMTPLLIYQIYVFKFLRIQLLKLICLFFIFRSIIFCTS